MNYLPQERDYPVRDKITERAYLIMAIELGNFVTPEILSNLEASTLACEIRKVVGFNNQFNKTYIEESRANPLLRDRTREIMLMNLTWVQIQDVITRKSICP